MEKPENKLNFLRFFTCKNPLFMLFYPMILFNIQTLIEKFQGRSSGNVIGKDRRNLP